MSLADLIIAAPITAALGRDGEPLVTPVTVSGWEHEGESVKAAVTFGPYMERVEVDAILVSINGGEPEALQATIDGGTFTLPAGMEWEYTLTISTTIGQN